MLGQVLLIESHNGCAADLRLEVRRQGVAIDLVVCSGLAQARQWLQGHQPDLVVVDLQLFDGSAFDLLPLLGGCGALILVAEGQEAEAARAMRAGFLDYAIRDPQRRFVQVLPAQVQSALEKRDLQRRLADQATWSELALGATNVGLWDRDLVTGESVVDDRWSGMLGYAPGELVVGRDTWQTLLHPDDQLLAEHQRQLLLNGDIPLLDMDVRLRHRDGHWVWVNSRGRVVERTPHGLPLRVVGTHTDITLRKQTEEANARQHRLLQAVARAQALYISSAPRHDVFADLLEELLQVTESEYGFVGEVKHELDGPPYLLIHAMTDISWDAASKAKFEEVKTGGMVFKTPSSLVSAALVADGPLIANDPTTDPRSSGLPRGHRPMCAFLALPVRLDGVNVALVGLANQPGGYSDADAAFLQPLLTAIAQIFRAWRMDADQRLVQAALEEGEQRHRGLADHLRAILGALPDPLFEIDAQGVYRYASCTNPALLTRPVEQLLGLPYADVLPPDAAEQLRAAIAETQAHGSSVGRQYHLPLPAGERWFELSVARKPGDNPQGGVVVLARDVTQRKQAEAEIERLAFHDMLTGLPNRRLLLDRLAMAIAGAVRHGQQGALLFIDLDNFKDLNDTLGHDHGDQLLQQVAQRLRGCLREADTVARLGGDEFVVMLEGLGAEAAVEVEQVGRKLLATLNEPYTLRGRVHNSTPSIGAALFGQPGDTVDELLKRADLAMYRSKMEGRNTLRFYDPDMQERVLQRALIEADLRVAFQRDELRLFFQPVVDGSGHTLGAEALVRWSHPERGMVPPAAFVPVAEQTGLILPLGRWVLNEACRHLGAWGADTQRHHWTLAVNVSAREFRHPDFVAQVVNALGAHGVPEGRLKLELTESMFLQDANDISHKMAQLKALGVSFSLDDFGTGYSSLSYLKRLPLDQLKIDQSFVRDLLDDEDDAAIVRAILTLADNLGLAVVAEGVETDAQRQWLLAAGCQAFQGYLFGRPSPEPPPA